jgi:hypothetical protein
MQISFRDLYKKVITIETLCILLSCYTLYIVTKTNNYNFVIKFLIIIIKISIQELYSSSQVF